MQRLFQMVMGMAMAVLIHQLPSAAWAKDTTRVNRQPAAAIQTPASKVKGSEVEKKFKPDLVVSTINFSPGQPAEGDEITLWVFVKNKGIARAGASGVRVRVGGETNPPVIPVPPLNPSQQFKYTKKVTFNRSGHFIVTVTADAGSEIVESSEGNNIKKTTIRVKSKKPDLIISKANYSPGSPDTNSDVTFWLFVKNIGLTRSEPSTADIDISPKPAYSGYAGQQVPALNPGQEWRFSKKFMLAKAGNATVTVKADRDRNVDEANEHNNQKRITVHVKQGPKPDLVVSKINFSPARPKPGEQVTVWYFVKNIGPGKSMPCILGTTDSKNSYHIWHEERVPALDSGREWRYQGLFLAAASGNFKIKAVIDKKGKVDESNENNNERLKDIKVQ
ncbi:MAG: CARDB domain-containing protein [Desulfobacteraceae bacterium]